MQITYLHHSSVLLDGSRRVLIDPFLPDGMQPPKADVCAVTHAHADHLGIAASLQIPVVANNDLAKWLAQKGVAVEAMNIGGTIEVKGVTFTMTPALHSGWLEEAGAGMYGGSATGFVITLDGTVIYHAGDTGLFGDMQLIGEIYHPDVAILPIGGRFTMGPREAMMAAAFVGAPVVIPVHYNTFPAITQDPMAFKQAIERTTDMRVVILKPGESWDTSAPPA